MKTIALFIHQPKCSIQSVNGIIKALTPKYRIKIFTRHELEDDFFDDIDAVCFPGGFGDSDSFDYLMRDNVKRIKKFLKDGGKYLGICMGAYWADKYYFDILDNVQAVQYITQPNTDTKRPHAKHISVNWMGEDTNMYFYDGCAFVGTQHNYTTLARYNGNGDPMAIIQGNVGLIGCHPEADKHWYESYSWMKKHWQGGQHELLLNFVDILMNK
jgi:glutamine amidotransferase-like uncharacterized protein